MMIMKSCDTLGHVTMPITMPGTGKTALKAHTISRWQLTGESVDEPDNQPENNHFLTTNDYFTDRPSSDPRTFSRGVAL